MRNLNALSTRCGVLTSPSRVGVLAQLHQQPLDQVLHRHIVCLDRWHRSAHPGPGRRGRSIQVPAALRLRSGPGDPDALYQDRENLASAKQAADIWAARLAANPRDFDSAYKLAQARYWLGTNGLPEAERKGAFEAGIAAARTAIALEREPPRRTFLAGREHGRARRVVRPAPGHQVSRPDQGCAARDRCELNPAFLDGSADRALGRWYFKVPGLFGGSNKQSELHLRKSLTYNPNSVISHLFLAETLADLGRNADARMECQAAIDAPLDPDWTPEDRRFKEQAKRLLQRLSR